MDTITLGRHFDHFHAKIETPGGKTSWIEGGLTQADNNEIADMRSKWERGLVTNDEYDTWVDEFNMRHCLDWGMPDNGSIMEFNIAG